MSEVSGLKAQLATAHMQVKNWETARRLYENPDFKSLILDFFGKEEAVRYIGASTDTLLTPAQRADALALAQAPGLLRRWMSVICQMGYNAEGSIPQLEQAIEAAEEEERTAPEGGEAESFELED